MPQWLERVDSFDDWAALSGRPGHRTVARTETVKFIVDLHRDGRTYFINTKKWELHYDFVVRFFQEDVSVRRDRLAELRSAIADHPVAPELMSGLVARLWRMSTTPGPRSRST